MYWNSEYSRGKTKTYIRTSKNKIRVPNFFFSIAIFKEDIWKFLNKWLLNRCFFTFSNDTEYKLWLEEKCYGCNKFDEDILIDADINTCNTLYKILDQQCLRKKDYPKVYRFTRKEFKKCLYE